MLYDILQFANWFILWYLIFLSLGYITLFAAAIPDLYLQFTELQVGDINELMRSSTLPPVNVLVSVYNEEDNILETVYSILRNSYPNTYLTIINDGSKDHTLEKLTEEFNLKPIPISFPQKINTLGTFKNYYVSDSHVNFSLIDKTNSGKSDSLNMALNANSSPLVITTDGDCILESDAISEIVFYLLTEPKTIAVGGAVYILNGCRYHEGKITEVRMSLKPLYGMQVCEYMRSFLFSRSGWNVLGGALCYAGAFTLFNYNSLLEIGGFDVGNVANDFEIITHLHAYNLKHDRDYRIRYCPSAIAWTDVPGTFSEFWKQRKGWQHDSLRSLLKHSEMLFNPRYGFIAYYTYPFFFFGEVLGAIVEFTAYFLVILSWALGILDLYWAVLIFAMCWGFVCFITMATALISYVTYYKYKRLRDVFLILVMVFFESFGLRQYHVLIKTIATVQYFFSGIKRSFQRLIGAEPT